MYEEEQKTTKVPNRIVVYADCEMRDSSFFVEGAKSFEEALFYLGIEYPETVGEFTVENAKNSTMNKCLDCVSSWITDDDTICGECGEYRLSKRGRAVIWFNKSFNLSSTDM